MPKDMSARVSYFYCASALSGAFSGLLAAAIAEMDGAGGYEGWRWIFILEGLVTVVLGAACFFLLIDTPALSTRWLEPDEIKYLELSMLIKQGGSYQEETGFNWRDLRMVLTNWRVYVQAYFLLCQSALSYGMLASLSEINEGRDLILVCEQVQNSLFPPLPKLWVSATPTLSCCRLRLT
jgi:MFS family permease